MLPRPERKALVKRNHFTRIAETLGAGMQPPPRVGG